MHRGDSLCVGSRGLSRRDLLRAGGLGLCGWGLSGGGLGGWGNGLPGVQAADPRLSDSGFGRARRCIFLFMWGGPSQLDTLDMKPEAPDEVRGPFQPAATRVPGLQVCEHFQRLPEWMDRVAVVRSLSHTDPAHLSSAHATVTGSLAPVLNSDQDPPSDRDTPWLGSMMHRLRPPTGGMPGSVMMPWVAYHPSAPGGQAPGQHGGWLGPQYDPLLLSGDLNAPDWQVPMLRLPGGMTRARLEYRRSLLQELDRQRPGLEFAEATGQWESYRQRVSRLLLSPRITRAFDLTAEPDSVRERYGRNLHGQCVLMARRLIEHDVPVVQVNWHNDNKSFWDTHGNNFNRLKDDLIPAADQALSALLQDLEERGLLEDTIVAWVGEFGRKPQITANNSGREHWPQCYSGLLAGGGIQGGAVYGASDAHAAYPVQDPVSPQDYAATLFHALGVDITATLPDRESRPHRICGGRPLLPLFG